MFDDDRVRQDPASSRRIPDQLSIDLLGRFAVCVGPRTIPCSAWRLRKAKSLLQLLALAPGHRMHRERVLELLWPRDYAQNRDNAANTLYRVLHVLRHVLQPDAPLRHVSEYVALTDDVLILCQSGNLLVDVDAFKEAAASARRTSDSRALARALDLYRGALLLNETDEEWVDGYRTDLHDRYTGLLRSAIRMHLERGDREGAIAHLQLLVTAQPDDEQACVALMCLHAAHQRFAALRLYQRLRESLREIGIEPERATQRLYAQLKKGQLPEHAPQIEYDLSRALDAARADPHPASTSGTRFTAPSSAAPSSAAPSSAAPSSAGQSSAGQSSIASSSEEGEARAVSAGSFVGREREVVEVARLLASHRVVTLSGTGGGGKSRLAREVASQTDLRDGVVIVELAELTDARLVPNVVAAALEAPEEPGRPLVETLARAVAAKEILLLLDNCEHLSAACAALITALLDLCPDLHVLVTSRRHLGVTGERVFPVSPLAFPAPEQLPPFEELQNYGAVRLFCDRVAACAPGFALSPGNAAAVVTICARLDGIPLALELAARRRGHMTSEQLARRLEHALDLLEGTGVQGSGRNETLRATLDWSYMLLDEPERALFRRLAAFAGSWSLEAAEALCEATLQAEAVARTGADAPGPPAMIRLLGRLVDDSLVQVEDADEQIRYRFLEPVRQYAQAKLLESGEQERLRAAHAQWCAALAGEGDTPFRAMSQVEQSRWLQTMDAELANLRAALHWARQHEHAEIGLRLAVALEPYWYRRGMLREASSWLEELLALPASQQARLRPAAVYSASVFALQRADWTSARRLAAEGVALCRDRGDTLGMLRTLTVLGGSAELAGDYGEARRYYEQCLELARWIGDVPREIVSLSNMADVAIAQGDAEGAAKLYRQCLVLARSADHTRLMGMALTNLGKVALSRGQIDQAAEYLHEGLLHMRKLEEARGIAEVLVPLGQLALIRGDEQEALARTVEAFEWYFHAGMQVGIAQALEALARIAIAAEAWEWAIQLLSAASALRECADLPPTVTEQRERERSVERVVRHFTGEAFAVATAQGRTRPLGEIVAELTRHARRWPSHWHRSAKNSPTGDAKNTDPLGRLTKRQREVAELVAQRLTDREIAERLALEKRTIETHVHHIFSQLHLHSRAELAAYMRERRMATVRADAQ